MRISRIALENFRSIKKLEIDLPQICALVGPNNAGKSNILQAINRVLGRDWITVNAFSEEDVNEHNSDLDISINLSFDPSLPYQKFKLANPVEITTLSFNYKRYKKGEHKGQRRLEQQCLGADGKTLSVLAKAPKSGEQHSYEPLVGIPADVRELVPFIYIGTNRSLKEQLPSGRYSLLRQLLDDIDRDLHDPAQTVPVKQDGKEVQVPRAERFQQLMEVAMKLLRTTNFEKLETTIKRNALRQLGFDPETDTDKLDFFFSPFDTLDFYRALDLRVREGEFTVSATELGEGIQNAIVLAILQAFEESKKQGAIMLIEEPEMFMHPQMQRSLYKTIRSLGENNQVIYTTHSPHFVTIPDYEEVLLVRKESTGTAVRRSTLATNAKRKEKLIKEFDPERNELFFASRLLLAEGPTEKLALPEYARRLGLDLDREGASIVEVGGKRNLMEFANIAKSFGIPTAILYDEDSSDFDKSEKADETEYNAQLNALATSDGSTVVWKLAPDYEAILRAALGEKVYQEQCQKYPKTGKPTRARLIAADGSLPTPEPLPDVLYWLSNKRRPAK